MLGEANGYLLREVLGLPPEDIEALAEREIFGTRPIGGNQPSSVPMETQVELGWIAAYDPDFKG